MSIVIVGDSGFVGTRLIRLLSPKRCINIDKNQSYFYPEITSLENICNKELRDIIPDDAVTVVLLAAEHKDNVNPTSLYYDVNVQGTKNVLEIMDAKGINNIIFTSSVAVYGLNKNNPNEKHPVNPFNHYGRSKWQAEEVLEEWYNQNPKNRSLAIIRPTVIFGERNRGNVFNLLKQIASGKFLMVGKGENKKSMAYIGNIVAFIKFRLEEIQPGFLLYNYIDKPDFTMNELVTQVEKSLNKDIPSIHFPKWLGMLVGYSFDKLNKYLNKEFSISSVRVKKFCATTQFDATKAHSDGFKAPYTLSEGLHNTLHYEFISPQKDNIIFETE
jgi:GlcNAc-P-P-Und epimerase